jgi:rubrerythrin
MGIQIEKNGKDFYEALAEKVKDKKARDAFSFLAGEEGKHIAVFQSILSSVQRYAPQESFQGEYAAYMKALSAEQVFVKKNKGKEAAKKITTAREAVELGIGFEKDSIIFYEGMKRAVSQEDSAAIDRLIQQEYAHLTKLAALKKKA